MAKNQRKEFVQDDGQIRIFIVPVDILDVPDLSSSEKLVYIVLRSYVNPTDPTAFPSYETIAKKASLSRRRVIDIVKSLIEKGLITKEVRLDVSKNRKIKNTSNMYTLITPKKQESKSVNKNSSKKPSETISPTLVKPLHQGSETISPDHYHLTDSYENDCMGATNNSVDVQSALKETAATSELFANEIYETLQVEVPKYCFVQGIPLGKEYINEIYIMLLNQFPNQISTEVISIACELYFNRACEINIPNGVVMTMEIKNPIGFFQHCYKDAIKQYKANQKRASKR